MAARKKPKKPARKPAKSSSPRKTGGAAKKPAKAARAKPARAPARRATRKPAAPAPVQALEPEDEVVEIFRTFDRDGSGSIDSQEFARMLEALGQDLTDDELLIALDVVDTDASGRISWSEFKAWWVSR